MGICADISKQLDSHYLTIISKVKPFVKSLAILNMEFQLVFGWTRLFCVDGDNEQFTPSTALARWQHLKNFVIMVTVFPFLSYETQ